MINRVLRYLFPRRRFWSVPREISAEYDRTQITREQQLIMMCGLARDPQAAQNVFDQLKAKYGDDVYRRIELHLRRQHARTLKERFWSMMRRLLGEKEPRKYIEKRRRKEPRL